MNPPVQVHESKRPTRQLRARDMANTPISVEAGHQFVRGLLLRMGFHTALRFWR